MTGMTIDWETANRITLLNLIEARNNLLDEMDRVDNGEWIHPEDERANRDYIRALTVVIDYYGGESQL